MKDMFQTWRSFDCTREHRAITIAASSARKAAEMWAAQDDRRQADYAIANGADVVVSVRDAAGTITEWNVTGREIAQYNATAKSK